VFSDTIIIKQRIVYVEEKDNVVGRHDDCLVYIVPWNDPKSSVIQLFRFRKYFLFRNGTSHLAGVPVLNCDSLHRSMMDAVCLETKEWVAHF